MSHDSITKKFADTVTINELQAARIAELDGRAHWGTEEDRHIEWYWFRAMRKTWALLIINGVLK